MNTVPSDDKRLAANVRRVLLLGFFQVFLVIMPIIVPFFESRGLAMSDVLALQALFALVVVVMEVPSGYIADLFGRRRTLIVGTAFLAAGHSVLIFADGLALLAVFETALGIGISLVSGADLALLYDTEAALDAPESRRRQAVGRLFSAHTASEALASVVCSLLLLHSMESAVYVQAFAGWIPFAIALTLVEPPRTRLESTSHGDNFARILKHLLGGDAVLRLTFLTLAFWSLTTFYAVWLLQKLWQEQGIELAWFGYLWAALMLIAALAGRYAERLERRIGTSALLTLAGLAPVLGYVGLAELDVLAGLVAATTFFFARGFGLVVLREALNARVPGEFRATANSLASFAFRGSFVLTAPFVGWVLDAWSMAAALWLLAAGSALIFAACVLPLVLAERLGSSPWRRSRGRRETGSVLASSAGLDSEARADVGDGT